MIFKQDIYIYIYIIQINLYCIVFKFHPLKENPLVFTASVALILQTPSIY